MITIDNVTFLYPKGMPALSGANAKIGSGIHLLLGPNGAGKTTLLKAIAGLLVPQYGKCEIDGLSAAERKPSAMSRVFFLPDDFSFPLPTVMDMVKLHAPFYPNFSLERLQENLRAFNLTGGEKTSGMSLGQRKKSAVAYALALGVDALLLDEPANGMDIDSKRIFSRMVAANLLPEQTILIATHTVHDLRNLFDGVTVLRDGHVALSESVEDLTARWTFVNSRSPLPEALFAVADLNGWHAIVPNIDGQESTVDYELLYDAVAAGKLLPVSPKK